MFGFTEDELTTLRNEAQISGMTLTDYCRDLILTGTYHLANVRGNKYDK